MYIPYFVYSSVDGHLGCFHLFIISVYISTIVNNAAMNAGM